MNVGGLCGRRVGQFTHRGEQLLHRSQSVEGCAGVAELSAGGLNRVEGCLNRVVEANEGRAEGRHVALETLRLLHGAHRRVYLVQHPFIVARHGRSNIPINKVSAALQLRVLGLHIRQMQRML